MELTGLVANQILIMLILILVGVLCYRLKWITVELNRALSSLVVKLVNPIVIFTSYQTEFKMEQLSGLLIALGLGAVSFLLAIGLARLFIRNPEKNDISIERFSVIYSNCGFMGIPVVNGIFGAQGVFYLTAYITVFNLFVWTHGVILMKGQRDPARRLFQVLKAPAIVAILSGLSLYLLRISLPETLIKTLHYIGGMNTPLAMIVAGVSIAQTNLLSALKKRRIYLVGVFRLLIVPLLSLALFRFLLVDHTVLQTVIVGAACPTGAMVTLFSLAYGKNSLYAAEIFAISTLLSLFTLPFVVFLSEFIH